MESRSSLPCSQNGSSGVNISGKSSFSGDFWFGLFVFSLFLFFFYFLLFLNNLIISDVILPSLN